MRVNHDGAVINVAILLEKTRDVGFGQTRVNTSNEKVGTGVGSTLFIVKLLAGVNGATELSFVSASQIS